MCGSLTGQLFSSEMTGSRSPALISARLELGYTRLSLSLQCNVGFSSLCHSLSCLPAPLHSCWGTSHFHQWTHFSVNAVLDGTGGQSTLIVLGLLQYSVTFRLWASLNSCSLFYQSTCLCIQERSSYSGCTTPWLVIPHQGSPRYPI